jgi:hypothetical protein
MWPPHYPESCPPEDARPADIKAFRFVDGFPCSGPDFVSVQERNPHRDYGNRCKACGLSVFLSIEDALGMQKRIPGFRKKRLAVGALTPDDGVVKATPSQNEPSHHTWWMPIEAKPFDRFASAEEVVK